MSKTFTSRPAVQARGRGTSSSRANSRGGGHILGDSRSTPSRGRAAANTASHLRGRSRARPGRMDPFGYPAGRGGPPYGANRFGTDNSGENSEGEQPAATNQPGQGSYAGGYTVFSPNERKRQQVRQMAERETAAYQEYKQANAGKSYNYVGTVGGGDLNQDQVRNRQANAVRAQKFNRLVQQTENREARKRVENEEIEEKRAEARRKAQQNAARLQAREAPADEVRRKREAFLRQLESKSSNPESTSPSTSSASQGAPTTEKRMHNSKSSSTIRKPEIGTVSHASLPRKISSNSGTGENRKIQTTSKANTGITRTPVVHNSDQLFDDSFHQPSSMSDQVTSSAPRSTGNSTRYHSDLDILVSMFPDLDRDSMNDLLLQLGSVESVMDALDIGD